LLISSLTSPLFTHAVISKDDHQSITLTRATSNEHSASHVCWGLPIERGIKITSNSGKKMFYSGFQQKKYKFKEPVFVTPVFFYPQTESCNSQICPRKRQIQLRFLAYCARQNFWFSGCLVCGSPQDALRSLKTCDTFLQTKTDGHNNITFVNTTIKNIFYICLRKGCHPVSRIIRIHHHTSLQQKMSTFQ
jgi:hypothetical protein